MPVVGNRRNAVAGVVQDLLQRWGTERCSQTFQKPARCQADRPNLLSPPTFSAISWEWCKECSLSWNILCCSELARRHVSHVHKVQEVIPGKKVGETRTKSSVRMRSICDGGPLVSTGALMSYMIYPDRPSSWQPDVWNSWSLIACSEL